ncbi:MAG: exodeoxyribonuclease VII small subunit [Succinivibrionaceae bacterium]|nr:exodeoxyribonuclease VII small subunit [Pseudomonadota bacterium]MDD6546420.1 exodeoxyribonuclease VII small subunit [Pseudomonadota bacterium]MDY3144287.1 exodeoxyribonuclease VII small subunit [Succinivibrionaceae bacterium]
MAEKLSFEETIQKIEAAAAALESGKLSLDESLKVYEESVGLIRSAEKYLESARQRVRILEKNPDGSETMKDTSDYSAEFQGA